MEENTIFLNEREKNIYEQYQNIVANFIVELESRDNEYPIEIFNEIRAIFTHLSRFKLQQSEKDILSAENHMKRAILDCFKYLCISIAESIQDFRNEYQKVDLSIADSGKFLPQFNKLEYEARKAFQSAKQAEIKRDKNSDEIYMLFEEAYNSYSKLDKFREESQEAILFASTHSKRSNIITIVSCVITIISIVVAVIGFAL